MARRIAMAILAAALYANAAFADQIEVDGVMIPIPYHSSFPHAQYPYAQAPNGCGPEGDESVIRDTYPGGVSFRAACNTHDVCYYTLGSNGNTCNEVFLQDLNRECRETFDLRSLDPRYNLCLSTAATMYAAVKALQNEYFGKAQNLQSNYVNYVAQVVASAKAAATFAQIAPVLNLLLD